MRKRAYNIDYRLKSLAISDKLCYTDTINLQKGLESKMIIRKTEKSDLCAIMPIFDEARKTIAALGIDQWQNGYPSEAVVERDIELDQSRAIELDGEICATFALIFDGEPTYNKIYGGEWMTGDSESYIAIHRVAISMAKRGGGIAGAIIDYAADTARSLGRKSLRIDTHRGNIVMRKMLEKQGFSYCGIIYLEDGGERVAYERVL